MEQSRPVKSQLELWRLRVIYGLIVVIFGYYGFRLFDLQVIRGDEYLQRAEDNRSREISEQTQRGIIFDRNGFVLARNVASYNIVITPAYLPYDEGAIQEVYRQLSELIGVPVNNGEITDEVARLFKPCETDLGINQVVFIADTNAPYNPVPIVCDVDKEIALVVSEKGNDWPGVGVEVEPVRDYPTGWLTSEIIGFLGPIPALYSEEFEDQGFVADRDKIGYAGVENTLQEYLGGKNGSRVVEVDGAGKVIRDIEAPIDPVPGNNITLTIDTRLQSSAKQALIGEITGWNEYLNEIRSSNGVAIAINPKTGEILALVSYPTYENNRMARFIPGYYYQQLIEDPSRPLFNHAISAEHPPGSVYKMAPAIGAINEGVVTLDQKLDCPEAGKITITQKFTPNDPGTPREYVCWQDTGHGQVDFVHGIAYSCDVYFYKIGGGFEDEVEEGLGIWLTGEYARALGYGKLTGIELPGEEDGLVPDPTWKRINVGENWATGDTYIASMGQGYVLSTPLQVLVSFAILANDGAYMKPTLVRDISDSEGNIIKKFEPELVYDITKDPIIQVYDENNFTTGELKVVEPWVVEAAQEGMELVTSKVGTAYKQFGSMEIKTAGKTGTAEYCDNVAQAQNRCQPGNWPTHAWYAGYAPADDPEIAVVAFVYNGGEGSSVAGPIVRKIMQSYFELKAIDAASGSY
ncbi:MAG: penicillin-binding protein 2 [Anaerolineaceae bacterium]|nr:penicillin-binding protein 2 [Anaerolineaceae bacterium]